MNLKSSPDLDNFVDIVIKSLKSFLLNNSCDAVCLLSNTYFENNECIGTGFCFVYFVDGVKKSIGFRDVYEGDISSLRRKELPMINSKMQSMVGKFWDYMVITIYKNGRLSIRFFYDSPPGGHMQHEFSI
ncbi:MULTISPECIES: hypothetical protein [Bombella]|uniref:Uncharacterized protein n=1 Tax=Bombella pluederhausensis TaxID=2967336 RepID=A0ABT3WJD8_9PROT|nr:MULTISPECIES: hypothetical protein [Bombella]MCX5618798.1 hypothetical protein [Bombella pluederhausensis]